MAIWCRTRGAWAQDQVMHGLCILRERPTAGSTAITDEATPAGNVLAGAGGGGCRATPSSLPPALEFSS